MSSDSSITLRSILRTENRSFATNTQYKKLIKLINHIGEANTQEISKLISTVDINAPITTTEKGAQELFKILPESIVSKLVNSEGLMLHVPLFSQFGHDQAYKILEGVTLIHLAAIRDDQAVMDLFYAQTQVLGICSIGTDEAVHHDQNLLTFTSHGEGPASFAQETMYIANRMCAGIYKAAPPVSYNLNYLNEEQIAALMGEYDNCDALE